MGKNARDIGFGRTIAHLAPESEQASGSKQVDTHDDGSEPVEKKQSRIDAMHEQVPGRDATASECEPLSSATKLVR